MLVVNEFGVMSFVVLFGLLLELSSDSEDKIGLGKRWVKRKWKVKEGGEEGDERLREYFFVVIEFGEFVRGKKNGFDYFFNLYE